TPAWPLRPLLVLRPLRSRRPLERPEVREQPHSRIERHRRRLRVGWDREHRLAIRHLHLTNGRRRAERRRHADADRKTTWIARLRLTHDHRNLFSADVVLPAAGELRHAAAIQPLREEPPEILV